MLLARELREQASVALMFLTGRDNEVDKILGLEIGADDYITKPFNPRELTIRARNLLSRTMNLSSVGEERRLVESYKFNGWELDINSRSLVSLRVSITNCHAVSSAPCCISAKTQGKFNPAVNC